MLLQLWGKVHGNEADLFRLIDVLSIFFTLFEGGILLCGNQHSNSEVDLAAISYRKENKTIV